jgi:hypothetical protein
MKKHYAVIRREYLVSFNDNGEDSLTEQALDEVGEDFESKEADVVFVGFTDELGVLKEDIERYESH